MIKNILFVLAALFSISQVTFAAEEAKEKTDATAQTDEGKKKAEGASEDEDSCD